MPNNWERTRNDYNETEKALLHKLHVQHKNPNVRNMRYLERPTPNGSHRTDLNKTITIRAYSQERTGTRNKEISESYAGNTY